MFENFNSLWINLLEGILSVWNYKVFVTSDEQSVLVSNIAISIILFVISLKFAKKISKIIREKFLKSLDFSAASALERISYYLFIVLATIFVLDISNVPLTVFTVIGTTFAVGIGLGSQNIANNFISGIIIMIEQPVKIGDIIEVKGIKGKIVDIGARCVNIQTDTNVYMLVPNSNILQDIIVNWTHKEYILKNSLNFKIDTKLLIKDVDHIIMEAINHNPNILREPEAKILYKSISKNYYDIEIEFWIDLNSGKSGKVISNELNRFLALTLKQYNLSDCHLPIV